jgi:hypothetical protein
VPKVSLARNAVSNINSNAVPGGFAVQVQVSLAMRKRKSVHYCIAHLVWKLFMIAFPFSGWKNIGHA